MIMIGLHSKSLLGIMTVFVQSSYAGTCSSFSISHIDKDTDTDTNNDT